MEQSIFYYTKLLVKISDFFTKIKKQDGFSDIPGIGDPELPRNLYVDILDNVNCVARFEWKDATYTNRMKWMAIGSVTTESIEIPEPESGIVTQSEIFRFTWTGDDNPALSIINKAREQMPEGFQKTKIEFDAQEPFNILMAYIAEFLNLSYVYIRNGQILGLID